MNHDDEQQSEGVYLEVTLPAFHLLACVIASLTSHLRCFHTLAIQTGGARLRMTSFCHTQLRSERSVDGLPQPVESPSMIVVRNEAVRWEITGQIPPGASIPVEIENGVQNFSPGIFDVTDQRFRTREKRLKYLPLQVTEARSCKLFSSSERLLTRSVHG